MAWSAELVDKRPGHDRFLIRVKYTDGVDEVFELVALKRQDPNTELKSHLRSRLAILNGIDTFNPPLGPIDPSIIRPPIDPPTPAQMYANRVEELRQWENAIVLGVIVEADTPRVAVTRQFLVDNFRMSFLPAFSS